MAEVEDAAKPAVELIDMDDLPEMGKPNKAEEESMTSGQKKKKRKERYAKYMMALFAKFKSVLIIGIDNVGSNQMAKVRLALRGRAVFLCGKKTQIRRILSNESATQPHLKALVPHMTGNVGMVFTNCDLLDIRNEILEHKVPAAAKTGAKAPIDVFVPPGPTGMDPGQTSFFQALNIATKIMRGCIEIISKVHLIEKDEKVTASHVSLLTKLGIKPFFYGIKVLKVYEAGDVFSADVLDFGDDLLLNKFFNAVRKLAAISMEIEFPNQASIPHMFTLALKKCVAIALETGWMFKEAELYKDMIENPDKYGGGGGGGGGSGGGDAPAAEEEKEEVKEEEEEESEGGLGGGGGLFGDSDDGDGDY